MAVQLGHWANARVLATCSMRNHEYVLGLGADCAIDYTTEDVAQVIHKLAPEGAHVVMDCVGGAMTELGASLVRKGGTFVSIVDWEAARLATSDRRAGFVFVEPNREQLTKLAELIDSHAVTVPHINEMHLEQAAEAQELVRAGHVRGKIVLRID